MTTSLWMLLGFAGWTLLILIVGIGVRRLTLIFRGRAAFNSFPADVLHGDAGYRRAMRAHANCVENLPVFGALVLTATAVGVRSPELDVLAVIVLVARMAQSSVHMFFTERNRTVAIRFSFFMAQVVAMMAMGYQIFVATAARGMA
jgi:uncharacterized MAPEG superfamily protein